LENQNNHRNIYNNHHKKKSRDSSKKKKKVGENIKIEKKNKECKRQHDGK
jgi:hypothetical protein